MEQSAFSRETLTRLPQNRQVQFALAILGALILTAVVLLIPKERLTDAAVALLTALLWPYVILVAIILFRSQFVSFISALIISIQSGRGFKFAGFELTALTDQAKRIPKPLGDEITLENIALLHTSFLSAEGTNRFNDGHTYYQFEVIVIAPDAVMDRIESVTYNLEDSWPEALRTKKINDRRSRFKMKELANGTSIVRADVYFRGQEPPLSLNRFIDLRAEGPRI